MLSNFLLGGGQLSEDQVKLMSVVRSGDLIEIKRLINEEKLDVNFTSFLFGTPLHVAIDKGNADVVKVLLENGADVDAKDKFENTPLHWAAVRGHADVVKVLLENGAAVDAKNNTKKTPLHLAVEMGYIDVVNALLENKATVDAKDSIKNTLLLAPNIGFDRFKILTANGVAINAGNYKKKTLPLAPNIGFDFDGVKPSANASVLGVTDYTPKPKSKVDEVSVVNMFPQSEAQALHR